jgi:hypothetical protein
LEKICRKLVGDESFGLPYWNWCVNGHMPDGYFDTTSALYDNTRLVNASSIADPTIVGLSVVDNYCSQPDFTLFAGKPTTIQRQVVGMGNIESGPHNYIHGGFILGNMGDPAVAAKDPIFYNHHCMVDLCWNERNVTRNLPNTNDTAWSNFNFGNQFCDENGNMITDITVLASILMPLLSYRYETGINGVVATPLKAVKSETEFKKAKEMLSKGADTRMQVKARFSLNRAVPLRIERSLSESIPVNAEEFSRVISNDKAERAILLIQGLSEPPQNSIFIRVFINKEDANQGDTDK